MHHERRSILGVEYAQFTHHLSEWRLGLLFFFCLCVVSPKALGTLSDESSAEMRECQREENTRNSGSNVESSPGKQPSSRTEADLRRHEITGLQSESRRERGATFEVSPQQEPAQDLTAEPSSNMSGRSNNPWARFPTIEKTLNVSADEEEIGILKRLWQQCTADLSRDSKHERGAAAKLSINGAVFRDQVTRKLHASILVGHVQSSGKASPNKIF